MHTQLGPFLASPRPAPIYIMLPADACVSRLGPERAPFTPWTGLSLVHLGGVRRPVGHESIRFHPFGKFIDSSRRNFETQLPNMIRLITFGPTTAGRKELIRRRGGDRRHPHLFRAQIIASNSFERSGPHATPRRRPKTTTLASSTNYNIQAARPVEAEGGTESSSKKINQQIWRTRYDRQISACSSDHGDQ